MIAQRAKHSNLPFGADIGEQGAQHVDRHITANTLASLWAGNHKLGRRIACARGGIGLDALVVRQSCDQVAAHTH
jgi:hypothetical protein